ncbi:MAG: DedA family protein [Nanoarchaeota archaeon]|nr:DedA family protein [Nanoarchaeota archaeon]MBU0962756.1 DedA family protein [Nanoarchaeota archaeon]
MNPVSWILSYIGEISIKIISVLGYPGIFILMALESMVFPLPSELIMPFAGFLIAEGRFSFFYVILASTLGSLFGSLLSYYMGLYGGNKFVFKFGKYFLLNEEDLKKTEKWFEEKGDHTIFISRLIPVVRHLISIPAGIGKMDLKRFILYTVTGATIWNAFLIYLGFIVGQNWESINNYFEYLSIPIAIFILIIGIYFVYRHIKERL